MATVRWYLTNAVDANGWQALSETAAGAATLSTGGWVVGTGATLHSEFAASVTGDRASTTFTGTTVPDGTLDTTLKDAFRTPVLSGKFASGNWTFQFAVVSTVQGGAADGQIVFRLIKANADGSGATEITSAQQSASVMSNVSASDINGTLTFNPGVITLTNQYLFVQVAWKRTGAGGMTTTNIKLRTGSSSTVGTTFLTADFVPPLVVGVAEDSTLPVVEFSQSIVGDWAAGASSYPRLGQTYSASLLGVRAVELLLVRTATTPTHFIEVELAATISGVALGVSAPVAASSVPLSEGWVRFTFDPPVSLSNGAIRLKRVDGLTDDSTFTSWRRTSSSLYAGGSSWTYNGSTWTGQAPDFGFRVYGSGGGSLVVLDVPKAVLPRIVARPAEDGAAPLYAQEVAPATHALGRTTTYQKLVQTVTPTATFSVAAVDFLLSATGTTNFDLVFALTHSGGGTVYSVAFSAAGLTSTPSWVTVPLPSHLQSHILTGGQAYWFELRRSTGTDDANYVNWHRSATDLFAAGFLKTHNGTTWTDAPTLDFAFRVHGYGTGRLKITERVSTLLTDVSTHLRPLVSEPGPVQSNLRRPSPWSNPWGFGDSETSAYLQIGQSFTVAAAGLALRAIELRTLRYGTPIDSLRVTVRSGSLTGTVLGTSLPQTGATLPLYTGLEMPVYSGDGSDSSQLYTFATPVSLGAGQDRLSLERTGAYAPADYYGVRDGYLLNPDDTLPGEELAANWVGDIEIYPEDLLFALYDTTATVAVLDVPTLELVGGAGPTPLTVTVHDAVTVAVATTALAASTVLGVVIAEDSTAPIYAQETGVFSFALGAPTLYQRLAQTVTPVTASWVTAVELLLDRTGPTNFDLRLTFSVGSASPVESVLVSAAGLPEVSLGSPTWVRFPFTVPRQMAIGVEYWLILERADGAFDAANHANWFRSSGANLFPLGVLKRHNGTAWAESTTQDFLFRVYGTGTGRLSVTDVPTLELVGPAVPINLTVAETVTTQDRFTLTYVVDRPVRVQDVPAVALTAAPIRTVSVADTISVLDVRRVGMPVTARLAETLTVAEFRKAVLPALVVRVAETVTVSEFRKAALPQVAVDVFDAVLVTDFRKALLPKLAAHPVEAVTVAEFRKALLPQLVARLAEVLTPADVVIALPRLARLNIAVAETVTAAESWKSPLAPYVARVQEVLTLVESIRALLPQIPVRPAETIAAIDVVLQQLRTARLKLLATEVVGVSEHVRALVSKLLRAVAESLTVADVVLAEVSTNEMRVRLEEILNITEFVKAVLALLTVRAVDTLSVTELLKALLPQLALKRFETITVAEFLKAVVPLLVRPAEAISASDLLKAVLTPTALRLAETITVSEFVKAAFPGAGSASFDTLVVSDLLKAVLTPLVQRPSESLTVAELWKAVVTPLVQRPVENILVTEFRRAVLPLLATKRFDLITVADVAQQLLTLRRLHPAPSSELIAVAEFVALAMSGAGKPLELLTVLDVVRTVLTPGLQKVSDIITIAELARAVLTPFLSRRADSVTVAELVKTVLTPFAVHPQDVVTVTDALLAFLQFVGAPAVQRVGIEAVTVAEFVKPVLPALFLRPAEALTVGEVLRIALQPLIGDLSEVITVTEFRRALLDMGDVDREVYDEVLVSEDVLTALTAIVHFVLVDLRAEDSQSRISGRLSGRVGSGSLRGLPLTGYLRSLAIPKAHRLYGSLRSPALNGFLRRLPVGVATRSTESAGVSDEARATLAVGPVTVRE